jgi:signal transduction histidine kinase
MIAAFRGFPQDRLFRLVQVLALLIASAVVVAFLRFHLETSAKAFREDFERQSFVELSRGETFLLARKLAALGKSEQVSCVVATKGASVFFEERNRSCETGFFSVSESVSEPNQKIDVKFVMHLPAALFDGLLVFLGVQLMLGISIFLSQRRLLYLQHEHEFELAALSQQVSHDLRSPLAVLKVTVGGDSLAKRAVERLENLVGHLQREEKRPGSVVALKELLEEIVEEKAAERAPAAQIELRVEDVLGARFVQGDPFEWKRVFSNLLNNAIESNRPEGKIEFTAVMKGSNRADVVVSDQGQGMAPDVLRRLGERGFTLGKPGGKGLGFFLARRYAESVGGRVAVDSEVGRGTRIKVEIPLAALKLVVLVDDDSALASAWAAAARQRGVEFRHFATTDELSAQADRVDHGASVYIDWELPRTNMSADELGRKLRGNGFSRVYVCTGRPKSSIPKPDWAVDIVGKTPPWL